MYKSFALTLLLLITQFSFAQIIVHENPGSRKPINIIQWEVNDLVYHVKQKIEKPLSKTVFAIVIANGETQKVPLFYNGDGNWVFRFSSATVGSKSFSIEGDVKELNGKKGQFIISQNKKSDRHGGICLKKEDPQHLYYQDGKHYFNLAFECDWLFALDYGKKEIAKTKHLLGLLNQYGFNQIVMNVYSYDVVWQKDPKLAQYPEFEYGGREDIFPFLGSNSKPDFSSLNIDFFKHFDRVISQMNDQEIVSHLMIYVWNKKVSWPDMQTDADNMYYDYVIKRYQAFSNIIWDVSKEALFYGRATNEYISERIKRTRNLDSYGRLVSVHDFGFCKNHPNEVDFISSQNWSHTLYQNMYATRKDFPNKPIFNIEHGGYEEAPFEVFPGAYANAEVCLRRNYMCLFAGVYTTYYWQDASWNVIIHNPFEQQTDFQRPHFDYFANMRKLFDIYAFENFKPDIYNASSGYNLTNEKDGVVLMYVPKENHSCTVNGWLSKKFISKDATEQWFNTLTGEFTEEKKYSNGDSGMWAWRPWRLEADAILIIKNLKRKDK